MALKELKKKLWKRLNLWLLGLITLVLLDEYVKEGYFFKFDDVAKPFTHEQLVIWLVGVLILINILKKYR